MVFLFFMNNRDIGKIKSHLDRLFEKKNGGAKGRKEGKSKRWEIHSEGVYADWFGVPLKWEDIQSRVWIY